MVRKLIAAMSRDRRHDAAGRAGDDGAGDGDRRASRSGEHPSDTIARLRGAAWREQAYALFYVGQFADAEAALLTSERHFQLLRRQRIRPRTARNRQGSGSAPFERFADAANAAACERSHVLSVRRSGRDGIGEACRGHLLFSRDSVSRKRSSSCCDLKRQICGFRTTWTLMRACSANLGLLLLEARQDRKLRSRYYDCAARCSTTSVRGPKPSESGGTSP